MTNGYIELIEKELTAAMTGQQAFMRDQRKKNHKTLFLLYRSLDETTFEKVVETTSSKQVWDTLGTIFVGVDRVKRI
jgi:predicted AlkP superfamily phosphohydrolase/phosphomutase